MDRRCLDMPLPQVMCYDHMDLECHEQANCLLVLSFQKDWIIAVPQELRECLDQW